MNPTWPPTQPTPATSPATPRTHRPNPPWTLPAVALLAAILWMILLLPRTPRAAEASMNEDGPADAAASDEALRDVLAAMVLQAQSPRPAKPPEPPREATGRSLDAEFAARLDSLNVPPGVLRILRAGAWQVTLADALGQPLPANPPDRVGSPWDAWPARTMAGTVTYGRMLRALQEAYARGDMDVPEDPGLLQRLAAEALWCAWLTACATGPLHQRAEAEDLLRGGEEVAAAGPGLAGELRRQADEAGRWCHAFFAARFTRLHGVPPVVASHLVTALGTTP